MITQVHFLLTYQCTLECEHCFVCSSPLSEGTFTPSQISAVLDQAGRLGTVDTVYFEGGEPFLFYPVLLEGLRQARGRGLSAGIVTNGYFATSEENARCFLEPIKTLGISDLSISNDIFHCENRQDNAARRALDTAREMGLPAMVLALDPGGSGPETRASLREEKKGVISGGSIMFRGRAAAKLSRYAEARDWRQFTSCPYEDLRNPSRLHVDAYGNLQICQGICMGNVWERPLDELVRDYSPRNHTICGPLIEGGPAQLAKNLGYTPPEAGVADACHLCWLARKSVREKFPGILAPAQVYCDR
ncbi:radical SAM protein [uncultured Methanoregula sp.]|uniref:radical SAM protein n=1 Tax=uncultured Methanoregula sp. TaxID=1005933 RepID=UPI002AAB444A|nr:radical SAM protein [uncultured Methanoregula sp.]